MHKWYVVQVIPTHEKKVKKSLEEQREQKGMAGAIEEILLPTENVSEVVKGEQRIVEKRLWPGYLMLKMHMSDEAWQYVKTTSGVLDFLGGSKPTPLSDREVEDILKDLEVKKEIVTQKHKFAVGDQVKIVEGVFVNFMGTVTDIFYDKGRLSVLVSIFGRDTRVDDLGFHQVEEIAEDNAPA